MQEDRLDCVEVSNKPVEDSDKASGLVSYYSYAE